MEGILLVSLSGVSFSEPCTAELVCTFEVPLFPVVITCLSPQACSSLLFESVNLGANVPPYS